ncbi:hypothetical protein RYH73_08405 [Olivibacter sp. CPCC 100613]|uniref:hypothetical protein n=1 Tax=Olivibacter sp. CPCC 100613 TaxID=3079931 RepID=UPI002FF549EA
MRNYRGLFLLICLSTLFNDRFAAAQSVWQWSVPVKNADGNPMPHTEAFLWIPERCKQVNAFILVQHNMTEEGLLENPTFRKKLRKLGVAEIWLTNQISINYEDPVYANKILQQVLLDLSDKSGYEELTTAPIIPMGHSAMATYPWNFALANPDRTLAVISLKGDAPTTNLTGSGKSNVDWGNRNIKGIPGIMIMGEYEFWEDRRTPGFNYLKKNPGTTPITFYVDAGRGHFDATTSLITFLADYIELAYKKRMNRSSSVLKPIDLESGLLMDVWRKDTLSQYPTASYERYKGDRYNASWVFNRQMASKIESNYRRSRFKKVRALGFQQQGKSIEKQETHANYQLNFLPDTDGLTFHLKAIDLSGENAKVSVERICGPFLKINDSTFRVQFDKIGMDNPKRSNDLWFLAHVEANDFYKYAVQQANMRIPVRNEKGTVQKIDFAHIADVKRGTKAVPLNATSSQGIPVSFYVKSGPAYMENGKLYITKIPPKTKFPVAVEVAAWQYGITTEHLEVKTAESVFQTFYIRR